MVCFGIEKVDPKPELRDRLFGHVDCLAGLIGPRYLEKPKSISATLGYLEGQWLAMGYRVLREVYCAGNFDATNLYVEIPGHGKRANEWIVLGAHYDTVWCTPGADDNASAVAVLLEASRLLQGYRGERSIRLIAFACEEPPHFHMETMGSQHHARNCRFKKEQIIAMLCLEMVGYFRSERGVQQIPKSIPRWLRWAFPKRANFLAAVGNLASWKLAWRFRTGFRRGMRARFPPQGRLPLFTIVLPDFVQEIRLSDNSSFWDQGYPALMLTDTSFLRNPHYHQASDTPETLDYESMAKVAEGVASGVRYLAG